MAAKKETMNQFFSNFQYKFIQVCLEQPYSFSNGILELRGGLPKMYVQPVLGKIHPKDETCSGLVENNQTKPFSLRLKADAARKLGCPTTTVGRLRRLGHTGVLPASRWEGR